MGVLGFPEELVPCQTISPGLAAWLSKAQGGRAHHAHADAGVLAVEAVVCFEPEDTDH